ncbi:PH domain-containing protein [Streptomyces caniscabiei]|uniref:PH domain-containing protein n=1 Tax=Streptomyces caniscabiei TaxID=2746961 RepID=UPI0029AD0846|nr:PH domain-containing protein [Streptomyces caniscabiei]MDX2601338.1 PH domain-containing protein [Streptomyces caniscabiei]MDX2739754.1 PH domain-containing protein [Streptomyces caniscabiei]MDX2781532.1 PH domain-containing protein [Streptomyces caniscabiei]
MSNDIDREYRRRRGIHPALLVTMVAAALIIAMSVNSMLTLGPSSGSAMAVAAWLFVATRAALEQFRARTSVTAEGVTVRGAIRTRSWAWSEIYGIRVEDNRWGSPRWSGYLYASDGTRVRLLHVDEYQLTDPIAEIADLGATALRLGLTSMDPRPEVEERIARGARRRKAWQRTAVASGVVLAGAFVVDGWLLFTERPTHTYLLLLGVPLVCVPFLFLVLDGFGERRHRRGLTPPATRTATGAPPD